MISFAEPPPKRDLRKYDRTAVFLGTTDSLSQNLVAPQIKQDCSQVEEESDTEEGQANQGEHHHCDRRGIQQARYGHQKPSAIVVDDSREFFLMGRQRRLVGTPTENDFGRACAFPDGHLPCSKVVSRPSPVTTRTVAVPEAPRILIPEEHSP